MQIQGLYLYKMPGVISKVLKPGWYPFGNFSRPRRRLSYPLRKTENAFAEQIYDDNKLPHISVNCIVGANGSGKSTLLDILYRIINNFAVRLLKEGYSAPVVGRHLVYAKGVNADLYFECDREMYLIENRHQIVRFLKWNVEKMKYHQIDLSSIPERQILENFFYTISTNYSLYAFNKNEYQANDVVDGMSGYNGDWLDGLFHKNDGYFTPIVLTPYRRDGNIQVETENRLAKQRVMAMALLSHANGTPFFEKYIPDSINCSIDDSYEYPKKKQFIHRIKEDYGIDAELYLRCFDEIWREYFAEKYSCDISPEYEECYHLALFYLAYKSAKICFTYEDYRKLMNIPNPTMKRRRGEYIVGNPQLVARSLRLKAEQTVIKIQNEVKDCTGDRSHITLKISICLDYIDALFHHNVMWGASGSRKVEELLAKKQISTFNDAIALLPLPFYNTSMTFRRKDEVSLIPPSSDWYLSSQPLFSLEKMSSGERQLLYSISYVLYHIKNIQSVIPDENRVRYHNICLIFDEVELYFHPDLQRRFLRLLLDALRWCNIDKSIIHSIQIVVVTHSPFVLSDMLTENTLYLVEGQSKLVERQTFGANYYDMLSDSFFFTNSAIGEHATKCMVQWIAECRNNHPCDDEMLKCVGDDMVKKYMMSLREKNV